MTLWQFGRPRSRHHYVSTTMELIATKVGRIVTYLEGLLPIKLHRSLITLTTWFCEITWHTISIYISTTTAPMTTRLGRVVINFKRLLGKCLWPPDLAGWWLTLRGSWVLSLMTLEPRGRTRSLAKLKLLYLYYHSLWSPYLAGWWPTMRGFHS